MFRPPKNRKEVLMHAVVALSCSFLFGDTAARFADWFFDFIDLNTAPLWDYLQFYITVHGLVGALSWGGVGAFATWRDKLVKDPTGAIKDAKDIV